MTYNTTDQEHNLQVMPCLKALKTLLFFLNVATTAPPFYTMTTLLVRYSAPPLYY